MAHISLDPILPGIRGPFAFRSETAGPLSERAHILLHENNSLERAAEVAEGGYRRIQKDIRKAQGVSA